MGRSASWVSQRLALLRLPASVQAYLRSGRLTLEHLETLRMVLLYRFAPAFAATVSEGLADDARSKVVAWAGEKNVINAQLLVEFIRLLDEVKKSGMPHIPVELALIRILSNNQ